MKRATICAASLFLLSCPLYAQTIEGDNSVIRLGTGASKEVKTQTRARAAPAPAAVLRGLDKISGSSVDLQATNQTVTDFGTLQIDMHECRYPVGNPNGDAYAHLTIRDTRLTDPVFDGWMVASSPALNALDHPRYDVWVIRCKTDNRTPAVVAGESSPRPLMRPTGG